ncbi:MAG: helix-turn-helix transcriptional regulator [Bacteroidales bacterium]
MVELELLSLLVSEYEEKHFPIEPPTLVEMIRERMSEMKLSQKDLADLLEVSPPRISEYLNGKSEPPMLSPQMCLTDFGLAPSDERFSRV